MRQVAKTVGRTCETSDGSQQLLENNASSVLLVDSLQALFCCRFAFYPPLALSPSTPYPPLPSYLSPIHFSPPPMVEELGSPFFPSHVWNGRGRKDRKGNHPLYNIDTPWVHLGYSLGPSFRYLQAGKVFAVELLQAGFGLGSKEVFHYWAHLTACPRSLNSPSYDLHIMSTLRQQQP